MKARLFVTEALKRHDIDAAFVCRTFFLYLLDSLHEKSTSMILVKPVKSTFAVRKADTLLQEKLNQALISMWHDKSLYKIKIKYLKPSVPGTVRQK